MVNICQKAIDRQSNSAYSTAIPFEKADCISHEQNLAAIRGKASGVKLDTQNAFLNRVGLTMSLR